MRKAQWKLAPEAALRDAELRRVLAAVRRAPAQYLAFLVMGNMGWRPGELVHMRVQDVDLGAARITELVLKKRRGPEPRVKPILALVVPVLRRFIGARREGWVFEGRGRCDVFVAAHRAGQAGRKTDYVPKYKCPGGHISRRSIERWFDAACAAAGIAKVAGRGPHALRSCFATRVAEKTKDPFALRDHLNHEDTSTSSVYVQRVDEAASLRSIGGVS